MVVQQRGPPEAGLPPHVLRALPVLIYESAREWHVQQSCSEKIIVRLHAE